MLVQANDAVGVVPGQHTWNYLGRFYGIHPEWLATFNGKPQVDLAGAAGGQVRIPTAQQLSDLRTEFMRQYSAKALAAAPGTITGLAPPTMTPLMSVPRKAPLSSAGDGNMAIVNAARMRRFSHTGDNCTRNALLRSPNPNHEGYSPEVPADSIALKGTDEWWKCNVLVGDALYAAGFDWPMSEFRRYAQPSRMLAYVLRRNYGEEIWASPHIAGGHFRSWLKYQAPTADDLKDARPGDVVVLHNYDEDGRPGHSAILTARPRVTVKEVEGFEVTKIELRVVDIYGEQWYDAVEHAVAAILRPTRRIPGGARASVGGTPDQPATYLDGKEKLSDEPVAAKPAERIRLGLEGLAVRPLPAPFSSEADRWLVDVAGLSAELKAAPTQEIYDGPRAEFGATIAGRVSEVAQNSLEALSQSVAAAEKVAYVSVHAWRAARARLRQRIGTIRRQMEMMADLDGAEASRIGEALLAIVQLGRDLRVAVPTPGGKEMLGLLSGDE